MQGEYIMKRYSKLFTFTIAYVCCVTLTSFSANAQETLRYSCSAQIFEAFGMERLEAFTKETGIKVDLYTTSSAAAVYRLMNGFSDIAGAAEKLRYRYKEFGYIEIPFCKDSLAVIINAQCPIEGLNKNQMRGIFAGRIKNWKEVGGPDEPITVIVPGENTAAHKNFHRMAMEGEEIVYDLMSYQSVMVIKAVKHVPWAISFIAHAAVKDFENLKVIRIDGLSASDKNYPYYQTFYFVTQGEPVGTVKKFIDFTVSPNGQTVIKSKGMVPILRQ